MLPFHEDNLQHYLSNRYPGMAIRDFHFHTSGWESDIYYFTLQYPGGETKPAVLRLYMGIGAEQKLMREAQGISKLNQIGYPVPAIWFYEIDPSVLGNPFAVMEKLEGQPLWKVLANRAPEQTGELLDRFSALLAQLHSLNWQPFSNSADVFAKKPALILQQWLGAERQRYKQFRIPGFLPLVDWLEKHLPDINVQPVVVHLDFHANNVFIRRDGTLAVIDWTQVGVNDFRADLSWTLLIMGDFGYPGWSERIFQGYQQAAGRKVEHLEYFQLISNLKQLTTSVIGLQYGMKALGLNPTNEISIMDEAPFIKLCSERIWNITGLKIKEVDDLIVQAMDPE